MKLSAYFQALKDAADKKAQSENAPKGNTMTVGKQPSVALRTTAAAAAPKATVKTSTSKTTAAPAALASAPSGPLQGVASILLTILAASTGLQIDVSQVPDGGFEGQAYNGQLNVIGGTAPYTFELTSGAFPEGITLDPNAGTISGTPVVGSAGEYSPVITVTDSSQ